MLTAIRHIGTLFRKRRCRCEAVSFGPRSKLAGPAPKETTLRTQRPISCTCRGASVPWFRRANVSVAKSNWLPSAATAPLHNNAEIPVSNANGVNTCNSNRNICNKAYPAYSSTSEFNARSRGVSGYFRKAAFLQRGIMVCLPLKTGRIFGGSCVQGRRAIFPHTEKLTTPRQRGRKGLLTCSFLADYFLKPITPHINRRLRGDRGVRRA